MTQLSTPSADPPESVGSPGRLRTYAPAPAPSPNNPVERLMGAVIRKLSWSRLADPRVAVGLSVTGLLLGMIVGATAPNYETLPLRLPLSYLLPSLNSDPDVAMAILYAGDVLTCIGLAGMLWAHSQGWRPNVRHLFLASCAIVAVTVSLTPVGSSDTASYAAYGRIAALGGNPYTNNPQAFFGGAHTPYTNPVGAIWKTQVSIYGPVATWIQHLAALIGGASVETPIWMLMILNGAVVIGVGLLLLKTSDDKVRATLFWTANPVLIQQLVSGGHLDTLVAAAAICAIQVARRVSGLWGDVLIGVLIGLAVGVKVNAVLVAVGLAWPLLRRHEWMRTARITLVSLVTVGLLYSVFGLTAIKPLYGGSKWVTLPSPWWFVQAIGHSLAGISTPTMATIITVLWPIAMIIVAWLIYQRISSDQPREVVAPFALTFAWILVAPWVFAWYTAIAWVTLTQVPRNRMTRWLTLVTVTLAIWHSSGGQIQPRSATSALGCPGGPVAAAPATAGAIAPAGCSAAPDVDPIRAIPSGPASRLAW